MPSLGFIAQVLECFCGVVGPRVRHGRTRFVGEYM